MESFWNHLPKPFFAMAPMADVTDPAWRALVAKLGKPDITWTEFVSADGLWHLNGASAGMPPTRGAQAARPILPLAGGMPAPANPLMRDLRYAEAERPIVAQFFTAKPEMMAYAARLAASLGFDGIDVNMGCPDRAIERQGAGAELIRQPALAAELIRAAKYPDEYLQKSSYRTKFVGSSHKLLPVSVKTRTGYNKDELDAWLPALLAARPAAITLHLRTRKEMSLVPARWELMKRAVELRDRFAPEVLLIGNGDVADLDDARAKARASGADGVMIGRGMFGNPWVFTGRSGAEVPLPEKLAALIELARAFEALSPPKHFAILKKHIKAFVAGFDGASELRARLMAAENAAELSAAVRYSHPSRL